MYKAIVTTTEAAVGRFLSLWNVKGVTDVVSASLPGLLSGRKTVV